MKALRFAALAYWRDLRAGELAVLITALAVAVAALSAVGFFTDRLARAMAEQAGEVLAADLRLESGHPLDGNGRYSAEATRRGLATARVLSFASMVYAGSEGHLASLRGVSPAYPLRGWVRLAAEPFGPAHEAAGAPPAGTLWVDGRLLASLGLPVGGSLTIGTRAFTVGAVLDYRPDQGSGFADLSPSVVLGIDDLESTGLIQPGSRATWALLVAGTPDAVADFAAWLKPVHGAGERLVEAREASNQLDSALGRSARFLSLAVLATLVLAAISVAITARRYAVRHRDAAALLRCLGSSRRFVFVVSTIELGFAALTATAAGCLLGLAAQWALARLLGDLLTGALPAPSWRPALAALATTMLIMLGFALAPLLELSDTPPARVLSRNLEPRRLRHGIPYVLAVLALMAILVFLLRDTRLVVYAALGLGVAGIIYFLAGLGLVRLAGRLRGSAGVAWRYGMANLARRQAASAVQIVAFGLGLTVLLLLLVVRNDLLREWHASLPPDAPNHFVINIQPGETTALHEFFRVHGIAQPTLYPWVRARLTDVNGVAVGDLRLTSERARAFAEREQNLSWSATLPADNRLTAGAWWGPGAGREPEVSVASEYSEDLGIKPGDRMGFDVAGERIEARVANVRKVRWDGFRPNFFLLFRPGVLDSSAGTYMTSFYVAPAARPMLVQFIHQFPTVTLFDVDAILSQVRSVLDRAALGVESVSLFTLVAGIIVLLAMVEASQDERRFESATLRALGASRSLILISVATEFASLGALSGVLAAAASTAAHYALSSRLLALPYHPDPWPWLIGPVAGTLLVGAAGVLAARRVVNTSPALVLRAG